MIIDNYWTTVIHRPGRLDTLKPLANHLHVVRCFVEQGARSIAICEWSSKKKRTSLREPGNWDQNLRKKNGPVPLSGNIIRVLRNLATSPPR